MSEVDPIPIIADMQSVRDLTEGITQEEYSDEKVTKSLKIGSAEVCLQTNIFEWPVSHKQYHRAVAAANYFAASDLIPKTIADRDSGVPMYLTFKKLGDDKCTAINEGLPGDTGDNDTLVVTSAKSSNYYQNRDASPYMVPEGFGGAYNTWNGENSGVEPF